MYESPIKIITGQIKTNYEDAIYSAVQNVGINVDREELLKALEYDRGQFEEGFKEGEKYILRHIRNLLPEWLYTAIEENIIKVGKLKYGNISTRKADSKEANFHNDFWNIKIQKWGLQMRNCHRNGL